MRRRLSLILTLCAWLLATGSQWDLVQAFAWGRMIAGYAQTMPLLDAVRQTFSPDTMCPICRAVADAKQHDPANSPVDNSKAPREIFLVCAPRTPWVATPARQCIGLLPTLTQAGSIDRAAPPLPPPRTLA